MTSVYEELIISRLSKNALEVKNKKIHIFLSHLFMHYKKTVRFMPYFKFMWIKELIYVVCQNMFLYR